jgi:hypothetical protein
MKSLKFFSRPVLAVVFSLGLCACSSVEIHRELQSLAAPIDVIDSNFVDSPYDNEIVLHQTPLQVFGA